MNESERLHSADSATVLQMMIDQFDWDRYHTSLGPATEIPERLRGIVASSTEADVEHWYWRLENFIVVQGSVFDAALPSVSVLLFALEKCVLGLHSRVWIYELIYQVVNGYADLDAIRRGHGNVVEQCKVLVAQHRNTLIEQSAASTDDLLRRILETIA